MSRHTDQLRSILADIADVPAPLTALDHVQATAETALKRALWLNTTYDLSGRKLLCLGDHDLTSLAVCAVNPDVEVTVVDVDDRLLEFVDARAAERGWTVRCLHADFRFGLPPAVREWADLVFSDPPYTPEGMALFAGRAIESLADTGRGRVLLAYGFSDRTPALGLKVQQELQRLGTGVRGDPARVPPVRRRAGDRQRRRPVRVPPDLPQSVRGRRAHRDLHARPAVRRVERAPREALAALSDLAPRPESSPPPKPRGPGWADPIGKGAASLAVDLSATTPARGCCARCWRPRPPGWRRWCRTTTRPCPANADSRNCRHSWRPGSRCGSCATTPTASTRSWSRDQVPAGSLDPGGLVVREVLMRAARQARQRVAGSAGHRVTRRADQARGA